MKFKHYADLYLKFGKVDWKNSTYEKNKGVVSNRLNMFFNLEIKEIKPTDLRLWLNDITDVSNKSKKHYLNVLSCIFALALQDEVISKNPIVHLKKLQHITPRIEPFTSDEVNQILELSKEYSLKFQLFIKIGFFTGMRTGEILSLKLNEIDLKNNVISINSTRSRFGENTPKSFYSIRKIPILNALIAPLSAYISQVDKSIYLFETQYSEPYRDTYIFTQIWKKILQELNLPYRRLYNMRHTYATNMLYQNFITPIELSKLLGHSNSKMVFDVYVNYLNSNLKDFNRNIDIYSKP